jgi:glycosyltransferase involved in cell wall biosynthesis
MLVTALCLTRNRRRWLPQAIACFLRQDYPEREMLILADGEDISDLIPGDLRVRHLRVGEGLTIGAKRNLGTRYAAGNVIATWDDDDHSEPGRISDQVETLTRTGAMVTGYQSMHFTDSLNWWFYVGRPTFCVGTSLCYRREWATANPFQDLQIHEDLNFALTAGANKVFACSQRTDLMHATIHAANTSPREQVESVFWQRCDPPSYWRTAA